jgi:LacI family transcriptional regulator
MSIPKLKDIAAATGVHEMTVSRALRNVGRMRPETRQRVLEAAMKLGYRPNAAAAAMRTGHTGCIALLSGTHRQALHLTAHAVSAIVESVTHRGGYLAHATVPDVMHKGDGCRLPGVLNRHLAEGVLLHDIHEAGPLVEEFLQRNNLPAVWMNQKRTVNAVYPDDFGAARRVTEQLLACGHRRIVFVRLLREAEVQHPMAHYSVTDRAAGYEMAMRQAGLNPSVVVVSYRWDQWPDPVDSRMRSLLRLFRDAKTRPTAVIVYRDGSVLMGLLQNLGIRIPEDVSIVSFSGYATHVAEQMVSWVPVPFEEMGRVAVSIVHKMIESGTKELPAQDVPYGEIASLHTVRKLA